MINNTKNKDKIKITKREIYLIIFSLTLKKRNNKDDILQIKPKNINKRSKALDGTDSMSVPFLDSIFKNIAKKNMDIPAQVEIIPIFNPF